MPAAIAAARTVVSAVGFNAKGDRLLSAANDGAVWIWDWQGETGLQTLRHPQPVRDAAFNPTATWWRACVTTAARDSGAATAVRCWLN